MLVYNGRLNNWNMLDLASPVCLSLRIRLGATITSVAVSFIQRVSPKLKNSACIPFILLFVNDISAGKEETDVQSHSQQIRVSGIRRSLFPSYKNTRQFIIVQYAIAMGVFAGDETARWRCSFRSHIKVIGKKHIRSTWLDRKSMGEEKSRYSSQCVLRHENAMLKNEP